MPFGLTNAPTMFMRMMDDILLLFTSSFVVVYLDGILIFSRIWEEHLQHSTSLEHLETTQIVYQFGEMLIWHSMNSIFGVHHG